MLKTIPKILIIIFLTVFILQLASLIFLLIAPSPSQAQPNIQVPIGNLTGGSKGFSPGVTFTPGGVAKIPWIGEYIREIYRYAIGIVGILAAVVLMFGGVIWLTAGGSSEKVSNAKSWITASLTGLVLALSSYMILNIVNPKLVEFQPIKVKVAKPPSNKGSCGFPCLPGPTCCEDNLTEKQCMDKKDGTYWESGGECPTGCCAWDYNLIKSTYCNLTILGCVVYENCEEDKNITKSKCGIMAGNKRYNHIIPGVCKPYFNLNKTISGYDCFSE